MTLYEVLDDIGYLCDTHDIMIEITEYGLIIRKYFDYDGNPSCYKQIFPFDTFRYNDVKDCVLEFERRLEMELERMRNEEK